MTIGVVVSSAKFEKNKRKFDQKKIIQTFWPGTQGCSGRLISMDLPTE